MAELLFTKRAARDLKNLEEKTRKQILNALKENVKQPMKHATKLVQSRLGTYRYRIGEFRVIFDIEGDKVIVLRIGHRRDIYRN